MSQRPTHVATLLCTCGTFLTVICKPFCITPYAAANSKQEVRLLQADWTRANVITWGRIHIIKLAHCYSVLSCQLLAYKYTYTIIHARKSISSQHRYKARLDSLKIHPVDTNQRMKLQAPPRLTYINTNIMQYIMLNKTAGKSNSHRHLPLAGWTTDRYLTVISTQCFYAFVADVGWISQWYYSSSMSEWEKCVCQCIAFMQVSWFLYRTKRKRELKGWTTSLTLNMCTTKLPNTIAASNYQLQWQRKNSYELHVQTHKNVFHSRYLHYGTLVVTLRCYKLTTYINMNCEISCSNTREFYSMLSTPLHKKLCTFYTHTVQ